MKYMAFPNRPTQLRLSGALYTICPHPGSLVGQAHLLDDVIDVLELGVDFRQRTLSYALAEGHALLRRWQEEGYA